jgi:general stress protein 26
MSAPQPLISKAAIEKIKALATNADISLFTTKLLYTPLTTRPMSTQEVDEYGNLWFMSRKDSNKNKEIYQDNRVQLFYSNKVNAEYLSVYGHAEIIMDAEKVNKLWSPVAKTWFKEGKEDPAITLIKVVPVDAYYWDSNTSKVVSLIKVSYNTVTL